LTGIDGQATACTQRLSGGKTGIATPFATFLITTISNVAILGAYSRPAIAVLRGRKSTFPLKNRVLISRVNNHKLLSGRKYADD
jgi:hypothetical protein